MSNVATVTEIFKRALEIRKANPTVSYTELQKLISDEFSGKPFPSTDKLTIPEYDNIAPEEDWTAGLPVILRGIQNEDWKEIALGIVISLEQVENYPEAVWPRRRSIEGLEKQAKGNRRGSSEESR